MSWQDRDYNQDRYGGGGGGVIWSMLTGSVPLGKWFGIRVRVHASLIILILLTLLLDYTKGYSLHHRLISMGVLFAIVLLHEFGHCIAARIVGGGAHEILMWPLGGLAQADAPHRPGAQFWTVAGGPLVNVLLCVITAALLWQSGIIVSLNPFDISRYLQHLTFAESAIWWVYQISYILLLFNLLPIYPLDGGQILQTILWPGMGYYRSMLVAATTGIVGSVVLVLYGLIAGSFFLAFTAVWLGLAAYQRRRFIKEVGPESLEEASELAGSVAPEPAAESHPRRRKLSRRFIRRAQREAAREQAEQARIDAILEKVSHHGIQSLSWWERRVLRKATERQRQRDLEYYA